VVDNLTEKAVAAKPAEEQATQASEKLQMCVTHSIRDTFDVASGKEIKNAIKSDAIFANGTATQDGRNTKLADGTQTYQTTLDGHFYASNFQSQDKPSVVVRWADDLLSDTQLKPGTEEFKKAVDKLVTVKQLLDTLPDCSIEAK
jgi:hypothetical protein